MIAGPDKRISLESLSQTVERKRDEGPGEERGGTQANELEGRWEPIRRVEGIFG